MVVIIIIIQFCVYGRLRRLDLGFQPNVLLNLVQIMETFDSSPLIDDSCQREHLTEVYLLQTRAT